MESRSEWQGNTEVGIVVHAGKEFSALGSVLTADYASGYVKGHLLTSWDGTRTIGTNGRITAKWNTPRSYVSGTYQQMEFTVNGRVFTGRTAGEGMLWKGRPRRSCRA